jgi:hypothetical protein
MTALITAVIPVLFKLLEMWLSNREKAVERWHELLKFIEKQEPTMPAEIKQNYDAQKERVKRLLEKKN